MTDESAEPVESDAPVLVGDTRPSSTGPSPSSRLSHRIGWHILLSVLSLAVLAPLFLVLVNALSNPVRYGQASATRRLLPVDVQWDVFSRAFDEQNGAMAKAFLVSAIVTALIVVAQLVTSALAAYAYAFIEFPFKRLAFAVSIATLLLPMEVTVLANVRTIRDLGWVNSYQSLVLPFAAAGFGIFLLRQGFSGIPRDLHEAARLDGFGHLHFLVRIALPLTRPVVAAFVLVSTLLAWSSYLWPRMVITDPQRRTLPILLKDLSLTTAERSNVFAAAGLIAFIPVVILLIVFQRHIVRGLTAGAVK
ncbi:MAG: carbohydrate ABC transporter permease [Acidimicrobiales bacterium]|nr:carbohydrate ABC transporter permease [Acidimicrobiales bacterium]